MRLSPSGRKVIVSRVAGFCFGVRRAEELAYAARSGATGAVATLGPLVHNGAVTARMRDAGIATVASVDALAAGTVVLSAHGAAPQVRRAARARGLNVVDATCPFVTRVHQAALSLAADKRAIVIAGDPGHTEVEGVLAALREAGHEADVVATAEAAAQLPSRRRVGVVSQTTQRRATFAAIVAAIASSCADVRAVCTVCGATDELQAAAQDLAARCDAVVVVGGRASANTRRLREVCEESGARACQVEGPDEIDDAWLAGVRTVGVTAGASTPDWLIRDVVRRLQGGTRRAQAWHHPDEHLLRPKRRPANLSAGAAPV